MNNNSGNTKAIKRLKFIGGGVMVSLGLAALTSGKFDWGGLPLLGIWAGLSILWAIIYFVAFDNEIES